jgi:signal transduction histidine kinase
MTQDAHLQPTSDTLVLFVEDADAPVPSLREALAATGATVVAAGSGSTANELVQAHDFALAVVGVGDAGARVDGLDIVRQLRNTHPCDPLPVLFVSESAQQTQRTLDNPVDGFADVVAAPLDPRLLARKLAMFGELQRERRQFQAQRDEFLRERRLNAMMIAVLTHDLRTPMTAVELSAEIVQRRAESDTVSKAATRIKSSIARMVGTIHHLLSISNVGSGLTEVSPAPNDLRDIAREAVADFQAAKPDALVGLEVIGETQAVVDAQRIAQVFSNLVGLAVEHGGPDAPVTVKVDGAQRGYVRLLVSTPAAFSDTVSASLFAAPSRPGAPPAPGVGLGLSIVEQLVRAHGGTVVGSSDATKGSSFDVMLPRLDAGHGEVASTVKA